MEPRPQEELNQLYSNICAVIGDAYFKISIHEQNIENLQKNIPGLQAQLVELEAESAQHKLKAAPLATKPAKKKVKK